MGKPKEVFFIETLRGTGKHRRYGQKVGGLMATLKNAQDRRANVGRQGVETRLWRATVNWELLEEDEDKRDGL